MKKVINRRLYDTDTAEEIDNYESDYLSSDFHYYEETLYRKKTGEFFLCGSGNGASPYSKRYSDGWGPGEGIHPLSLDDAKAWVERHMSAECYINLFGEPEE